VGGGQFLSWRNADDVLRPGAVRAVVEQFRSDPAAMMVYGQADFVDGSGLPIEPLRRVEPFNLARLVEVHDYIVQPAAFVRREALAAVGHVDETLHWSMDWDLWIRIGQRFPVRYLPVLLATVRLHAETKTYRAGFSKLREMHRIVRRHSRRRFRPSLIRAGHALSHGAAPTGAPDPCAGRPPSPVGVASLIETGRFPWERGSAPGPGACSTSPRGRARSCADRPPTPSERARRAHDAGAPPSMPIAVIGMALRAPGDDAGRFWQNWSKAVTA
jgi:hypothetical protein